VLTLSVHVHPGASKESVGGSHDGALSVYVQARAVDGAATEAVLKAVAKAFHLRPRQVTLVRGHTARTKMLSLEGADSELQARLTELLGA